MEDINELISELEAVHDCRGIFKILANYKPSQELEKIPKNIKKWNANERDKVALGWSNWGEEEFFERRGVRVYPIRGAEVIGLRLAIWYLEDGTFLFQPEDETGDTSAEYINIDISQKDDIQKLEEFLKKFHKKAREYSNERCGRANEMCHLKATNFDKWLDVIERICPW